VFKFEEETYSGKRAHAVASGSDDEDERGKARFFHLFQLFFSIFFGLGFRVRV
jgi:hypothetical protein